MPTCPKPTPRRVPVAAQGARAAPRGATPNQGAACEHRPKPPAAPAARARRVGRQTATFTPHDTGETSPVSRGRRRAAPRGGAAGDRTQAHRPAQQCARRAEAPAHGMAPQGSAQDAAGALFAPENRAPWECLAWRCPAPAAPAAPAAAAAQSAAAPRRAAPPPTSEGAGAAAWLHQGARAPSNRNGAPPRAAERSQSPTLERRNAFKRPPAPVQLGRRRQACTRARAVCFPGTYSRDGSQFVSEKLRAARLARRDGWLAAPPGVAMIACLQSPGLNAIPPPVFAFSLFGWVSGGGAAILGISPGIAVWDTPGVIRRAQQARRHTALVRPRSRSRPNQPHSPSAAGRLCCAVCVGAFCITCLTRRHARRHAFFLHGVNAS